MNKFVLRKLLQSFTELESAITNARKSIEKCSTPQAEILTRITSYEDILLKQKIYVGELCQQMHLKNWSEVSRVIRIINGLSTMIRDDARELLAEPEFSGADEVDAPSMLI